jgi:hypothetical protein
MRGRIFAITLLLGVTGPVAGTSYAAMPAQQFAVRIENVSTENTLKPSNGAKAPAAVAPGVWLVHPDGEPLFTQGKPDRGKGLEALAEDGNPSVLAMTLREQAGVIGSGVFNTPVGASGPAPIGPGGVFEFTISAAPGSRLSFAMMFGQSNDLFYAPGSKGISLFDANGHPRSGEITSSITLWDAGTEVNEEPGIGPNQAPRQAAPHTGPREHGVVRPISEVKDGFHYPAVSEVIRVTITPQQQMAR